MKKLLFTLSFITTYSFLLLFIAGFLQPAYAASYTVSGVVKDANTGAAISGAWVNCNGGSCGGATTSSAGTFRLTVAEGNNRTFTAGRGSDYPAGSVTVNVRSNTSVTIRLRKKLNLAPTLAAKITPKPPSQATIYPTPVCLRIEGYVYEDRNRNGIRESGEGISGAKVTLHNVARITSYSRFTSNTGLYQFNCFERGTFSLTAAQTGYFPVTREFTISTNYRVRDIALPRLGTANPFIPPTATPTRTPTPTRVVIPTIKAAAPIIEAVKITNLATPQQPTTNPTYRISGNVWYDRSPRNSEIDLGESMAPGVSITLTGEGVTRTRTSVDHGSFDFGELKQGLYTLRASPPTGWVVTTGNPVQNIFVGKLGSTTVNRRHFNIGIAPTFSLVEPILTQSNLTCTSCGKLTGSILAEQRIGTTTPFANVLVDVSSFDSPDFVRTVMTDRSGNFTLENVPVGRYLVSVIPPNDYAGSVIPSTQVTVQGQSTTNTTVTVPEPSSQTQPTQRPSAPTLTPIPTPVPGDINRDGKIDINDFNIWQCEFLGNGICDETKSNKSADLNRDGLIDLRDFAIWRNVVKL